MGKGDIRTRRGKLFRGTFGKTRPRHGKKSENTAATPTRSAPAGRRRP